MGPGPENVETSLLRVPYESLRRISRDRKYTLDEVSAVLTALKDACQSPLQAAEAHSLLDRLVNQVQGLKRKCDEAAQFEEQDANRCRARLQHLKDAGAPPKDSVIEWNRPRLDRLLVDHLMRTGRLSTALQLAEQTELKDLVDLHIFTEAQGVLDGLHRHNCGPALLWCTDNHAKLKKIRSKFEFRLRVQEFVELVRADAMMPALKYAQQHLAPHAASHMAELQQATALLAFQARTACQPYAALLAEARWEALVELFLADMFRLHSLPPRSLLEVHLQAGLSALKTPQSYRSNASKEDPLHHQTFQRLAEGLPRAKHVHSKLVCHVTGQIMDEHNLPMVMPNGTVYSEAAVDLLAGPDGPIFTCPKSGTQCKRTDLKRAFMS